MIFVDYVLQNSVFILRASTVIGVKGCKERLKSILKNEVRAPPPIPIQNCRPWF